MSKILIWTTSALTIIVFACAGCGTLQAYPGGSQPRENTATIKGDVKFGASRPVWVTIRKVDQEVVGVGSSKVSVLPGPHTVIADCEVSGDRNISRHVVDVDTLAGETWILVAVVGPGNRECIDVIARRTN